jgi:glycosyltransferase involved in cell wall biosynthesis
MNKEKPLISILMPNFNNEKYLNAAIESVLNQSYKNFEFIIIDDCSTDNSWKIIQKYAKKDKRIKAYRNEKNLKIVKTLNKALDFAKGKFIGRMDGDDLIIEKKFEIQINFLEKNPSFVGVGTNLYITDVNMEKIGVRKYESNSSKLKKILPIESPFAHATMVIKSEILKKYKYKVGLDLAEDYDLWFRILKKHKMSNISQFTYYYRQHPGQGKFYNLKGNLLKTLKVKMNYIFKKEFFSFYSSFYFILQLILTLFPERFILWLFYKLYKT